MLLDIASLISLEMYFPNSPSCPRNAFLFVVLNWKELKAVILTGDLCTEITAIEYQELGEVCACSQTWVRLSLLSKQTDTVLYVILL